jgi:hypothetical protein
MPCLLPLTNAPWRQLTAQAAVAGSLALLAGCGGGGSSPPAPPDQATLAALSGQLQLQALLTASGTQISCKGDSSTSTYRLMRETAAGTHTDTVHCPGVFVRTGDRTPARWTLEASVPGLDQPYATITTSTQLPNPTVVADGDNWVVLPASVEQVSAFPNLKLVLSAADGTRLATFNAPTAPIPMSTVTASTDDTSWSWHLDDTFDTRSAEAAALSLSRFDLGYWGALALGDTNNDGAPEILGSLSVNGQLQPMGYEALGLATLFDQRVFRDVRIVDLNNDGITDMVANVYGGGCTLIGIGQADGSYAFQTPTRADGSCIDGHGETVLVADFDGDGLIDIVLPSYERLDFLKNLGDGLFVEEADQIGLSLPVYRPTFEGAAAVDIDLNGTVDIVLGGEVMLNDSTGHFTRVSQPFQSAVMQDEGLSVVDLDGDGIYDVVKLHPVYGLRMFWGRSDRVHFTDTGYLNGGAASTSFADGLATGFFTGNVLPDIFISGGDTAGTPPQLCTATKARAVSCLKSVVPAVEGQPQDLLMVTDVDGDGQAELVSRSGSIKVDRAAPRSTNVFQIDLRDAQGRATLQGHSLRAICTDDSRLLELTFVDGGNGYMAQRNYVVSVASADCPSIWVDVATRQGFKRFGPYEPGLHGIKLAP